MPKTVQIREVRIEPDGAKETVVDPAKEAEEKCEKGSNPETNGTRVTTSAAFVDENHGGHGAEAHEHEGIYDGIDAGKTGAEDSGEENVETEALAINRPIGQAVEKTTRNPQSDARHDYPQDSQFVQQLTDQAKSGMKINGARSDNDEKAPNEIDSSRDVLGVVAEKVNEQRRYGKEEKI